MEGFTKEKAYTGLYQMKNKTTKKTKQKHNKKNAQPKKFDNIQNMSIEGLLQVTSNVSSRG